MEFVPEWSDLVSDLLAQVAGRLPLMEDFMAFRGVCTTWRGASPMDTFKSKVPLLMLAENDDERDEREFYSLSNRKICAGVPFPAGKGKRCVGVRFGWMLTLSGIVDNTDGEVNLVKPFDPSQNIQLPNMKTFPQYDVHLTFPEYIFIGQAMLSANPSETSDFVLLVMVNQMLGFWRNGDEHWTKINLNEPFYPSGTIGYCNGKMYAINSGRIFACDPSGMEVILEVNESIRNYLYSAKPYLVESSDGELLLIMRDAHFEKETTEFKVVRVDLVKRTCEDINNVGKDAIFVGDNSATAVAAADFPGVLRPNCIYFTDDNEFNLNVSDDADSDESRSTHSDDDSDELRSDDDSDESCSDDDSDESRSDDDFVDTRDERGGGKDMGIYNVEDKSIERLDVESFSHVCPPQWIFSSV